MGRFVFNRVLFMIITIFLISIISFVIINLPPGDYLTSYIAQLQQEGTQVTQAQVEHLRERYGLDRSVHVQYYYWISGFFQGDLGYSFEWNRPVNDLIWERLGLTLVVAFSSLLFEYIVALPIGIYSALKQHTIGDYIFTFFGFLGVSIPNFLLALVLMYISFRYLGLNVGGLFSPEYADAAWSMGKFMDLLSHLWVPMVVVGTAGTARLIRYMRANLLDELGKPYVTTAKSKGLSFIRVIFKYPVRIAINPFVSIIGWEIPRMISAATITAVVLNLPTAGPLLLQSLLSQDMYLAGSIVLLLSILTVIGTFVSDILLAMLDPRIRYS